MRVYFREAEITYRRSNRLPEGLRSGLRNSRDVAEVVRPLIGSRITESFLVIALDAKNRLIGYHEVARGSVSSCPLVPMDVFRYPIIEGASGIVISHNHPSGDPTPSDDDIAMTKRLCRLAPELGLRILDHLIVTEDKYLSFLDAGLMGQ